MTAEAVARTIQLILAPVVMVSACAILVTGLLQRYSAINDRLRTMARERLELLRGPDDALVAERIAEIDAQAPGLLRRHTLMRDSLVAIYSAVLVFIIDMFVIALAAGTTISGAATAALVIFLVATTLMLLGAAVSVFEIRISNVALHFETDRVLAAKRTS